MVRTQGMMNTGLIVADVEVIAPPFTSDADELVKSRSGRSSTFVCFVSGVVLSSLGWLLTGAPGGLVGQRRMHTGAAFLYRVESRRNRTNGSSDRTGLPDL